MPTAQDTIETLLHDLNAAWLDGRIENLGEFFAADAVLVPPGGGDRLVGREAVVESFRQYAEHATTHAFEVTDLAVDVIGPTAVARMRFRVRYEYSGSVYDETGLDLLVLAETETGWHIVWRTQRTEEVE